LRFLLSGDYQSGDLADHDRAISMITMAEMRTRGRWG
jgi:hypothetical protein